MAASVSACDKFILLTKGCSFLAVPFGDEPPQRVDIPDLEVKDAPVVKKSRTDREDGQADRAQVKAGGQSSTNRILTCDVSPDGQFLALCDDRKFLHVYQCVSGAGWRCVSSRCVSRRCTAARFTQDGQSVVVADKSGDVFAFPVTPVTPAALAGGQGQEEDVKVEVKEDTAAVTEERTGEKKGAREDGEKEDGEKEDGDKEDGEKEESGEGEEGGGGVTSGELKLGHLSMVLDMLLIDHDQCVVTCDRDEKIRVSDFPDSYNIRSYCLGHTAFVISLVCDSRQKVLMSGSGDCTVRLWSLQGKQLLTHNVLTDLPSGDVIQDDPNPEPPSTETTDKPSTDGVTTGHRPAIQQLCFCEPCGLLCVAMYRSPQVLIYQLTYPPPSPDPDTDISQPSLSLLTSLSAEGLVLSMSVSGCVLWLLSQRDSILKLSAHRMDGAAGTVQEVEPSATGEGGVSRLLHVIGGQADFLTVTDLGAPDPIPHLWKSHTDGYIEEYKERKRQRMEGKEESRWGRKHQRRPERQTKR